MRIFTLLMSLFLLSSHAFGYIVARLDQVTITPSGIYVELNGAAQPVESITLANDGYVVAIPKPKANCPVCDFEIYEHGGECPACGFPYEAKKSL